MFGMAGTRKMGGNKWTHEQTRRIRANEAARMRKIKAAAAQQPQQPTGPEKCTCGRFKGNTVCQCRIDQVRKEMVSDEQLKICLKMGGDA